MSFNIVYFFLTSFWTFAFELIYIHIYLFIFIFIHLFIYLFIYLIFFWTYSCRSFLICSNSCWWIDGWNFREHQFELGHSPREIVWDERRGVDYWKEGKLPSYLFSFHLLFEGYKGLNCKSMSVYIQSSLNFYFYIFLFFPSMPS